MNADDMEKFRNLLKNLEAELKLAVEGAKDFSQPVSPDNAIGRLTRMEAIQSQNTAMEFRRRNEFRLRQIEEALQRLEAGTFGICLKCRKDIPQARLAAKPETQICVPCIGG